MSDEQALTIVAEPSIIVDAQAAEKALDIMTKGDLSRLKPEERATFLANMAKSLGLNPLSKPVDLIQNDKGQLIVYFNKGATDQLRAKHKVNLQVMERYNPTPSTYAVLVRATLPNGRQDEATGVVVLTANMDPSAQANAVMRCETKGKRRATLSILGLGLMDESETDTIPLFKEQLAQANEPRRLAAPVQARVEQLIDASAPSAWEKGQSIAEIQAEIVAEVKPATPQPVPAAKAHVITARKLPVAAPVVLPKQ